MREKIKNIPDALKLQMFIRFGLSMVFVFLFVLIMMFTKDLWFALPCLIAFLFLIINGGIVLYDCLMNGYVIIIGECVGVERTPVLRRVKAIELDSGNGIVRVPIRHKLKRIQEGKQVVLYVSSRTAVCETGSEKMLCGYYAIEVK